MDQSRIQPDHTTSAAPPHVASEVASLDQRLKSDAKVVCDALRELCTNVPVESDSPQEFARVFKVHRTVAGRLLNALKLSDPLASLCQMPGAEGLRMIIKGSRTRVGRDVVTRANAAVAKLERVLQKEIGGWSALDCVASDWLPETRRKFEMANKQGIYKCVANLQGARSDAELCTIIFHPDESGERVDAAMINGLKGLVRLRPSASICLATIGAIPAEGRPQPCTIEGVRLHELGDAYPLLEQCCSQPIPRFRVVDTGHTKHYVLSGDDVGPNSAVDLFASCVIRGRHPRYRTDPPVRIPGIATLNVPAKTIILDMLLHEDVYPGVDPELIIYNTNPLGIANPNDPSRDIDRMDVTETVQYLGQDVTRFRAAEIGQYVEMVRHVCNKLDWDPNRLRGYRCRVQYPIYGAQICMAFDPPPAPHGNTAATVNE